MKNNNEKSALPFDEFYNANDVFPTCENNSDMLNEMTIETFKWDYMSKSFQGGEHYANMKNQEKILKLISDLEERGHFYVFENREDLVEGRTDWESLKDTADSFYYALMEIKDLMNNKK